MSLQDGKKASWASLSSWVRPRRLHGRRATICRPSLPIAFPPSSASRAAGSSPPFPARWSSPRWWVRVSAAPSTPSAGREVLAASNVIIAIGLVALAFAHSQPMLWFAWLILGPGHGCRPLRHRLRHAGTDLWDGCSIGHHRHHAHCRVCQHGRVASHSMGRERAWLARDLSRVGGRQPHLACHSTTSCCRSRPMSPRPKANGKPHIPIDRPMIVLGLAFAASGWSLPPWRCTCHVCSRRLAQQPCRPLPRAPDRTGTGRRSPRGS